MPSPAARFSDPPRPARRSVRRAQGSGPRPAVFFVLAGALLAAGCRSTKDGAGGEGDPEKAIATLREAMQTARRGELDAAAELARRATRERPGFVDPWFALAAIEQERGDLPAARAAYMEILAIDPTQTAAGTALAHTFLLEKKAGEAREWLLRSIESDPGAEAAFFNLGSLAESSGAWDEAVGWYRISAALDGRDPRAPHAAARVRLRAGRTEEAHALLKEALRRAPEYGPSLSLLANPAPQPDATR